MHFHQPVPFEFPGHRAVGVVLLHAYTGSPNDMNMLARALEREGFGVMAPLFAGHGTLEPQDILRQDPNTWWQQTQQAVAHMQTQYEQVAVFGLSMGGIFAMKAIAELPTVTFGGTFCAPITPGTENIMPNFMKYNHYMRRLAEQPADEEVVRPLLATQLKAIRTVAAGVAAELGAVKKPVFIGQGGADKMIDPQRAVTLKAAMKHAAVSWHWYEGADHVITVNSAHHQLEQDVITFSKENEGQI